VHPGYFAYINVKTQEGKWSCCGSEERDGQPCSEDRHKFYEWPDEEAKKYFFDRPLKNPSDSWKDKQ
jgi:hypothetical protein